MKTYEEIHEIAAGIHPPEREAHIRVEWILDQCLAIGRDADGRHLLVLAGEVVAARSEMVRKAMTPGRWKSDAGTEIEGTLLRLHAGNPFLVAATTIAVELLRRDLGKRPLTDVFPEVEPFIELVIQRIVLPPDSLLGLLGELIFLDYLLEALTTLSADKRPAPRSVWRGYSRQSRDFRINRLAIEVKTTSGQESRHHIGSLDQVEPRRIDDDRIESLFLASIGLAEQPIGSSRFSISQLVKSVLTKLPADDHDDFLDRLRDYGPEGCIGYDHRNMADWEPYTRRHRMTFEPRLYDMSDPNVRILRRADLQDRFVLESSLSYQIELPATIPGSHGANPQTNLRRGLQRLLQEHS